MYPLATEVHGEMTYGLAVIYWLYLLLYYIALLGLFERILRNCLTFGAGYSTGPRIYYRGPSAFKGGHSTSGYEVGLEGNSGNLSSARLIVLQPNI